jgi:hypothetical protein
VLVPEVSGGQGPDGYGEMAGWIRDGLVTWPAGSPRPIYFSPFRDSLVIREAYAMERRAAEERDRREWIEGIRRRLGLVAEVHRCQVHRGNPEWIWSCLRDGCHAAGYFCPSQADAFGRALAHARSFVPRSPGPGPWSQADVMIVKAIYPSARILPAGRWMPPPWQD